MKVTREFTAASVNPRSHCLVACKNGNLVVYASNLQLVVQTIPKNKNDVGVIVSVSERRHDKPITVLHRVKSSNEEIFLTGGVDKRINVWKLPEESLKLQFLSTLEGATGSIGAVCGCTSENRRILAGAWVGADSYGFRVWWTDLNGNSSNFFDIGLESKAFVLCLDSMVLATGNTIIAAGTSKRLVELYGENEGEKSFSRLISVAGHTDWIHSIAFNDDPNKTLLASAGQDAFVRLWDVGPDVEDAEDVLTSTKNRFSLTDRDGKVVNMKLASHAVLSGHEDWVHSTTWSSDGRRLLTASSDKSAIIWREVDELWRDDVRLGIVGGQAAGFYAASFSSTGNHVVASSYFGGIYAWISDDNDFFEGVTMTGGHVGEVRDLDWQRSANDAEPKFLLSVGQDQTTRAYSVLKDGETMVEIGRPQVHGHDMQCIASVSSSVFVSGAEEKIFRAFRAPKSFVTSLETLCGIDHQQAFGDAKLAEFGACVPALGLSNKAMVEGETVDGEHWEEDAFRAAPTVLEAAPTEDFLQQNTLWPEEHKLYGHGYEVYAVAVNPNGTVLATSCKSSHATHSALILWDTSNWSRKADVQGHQLTVTQIEWNPSGSLLLSVSRDRTAKLYRELDGNVDGFNYKCVWTSQKEHSRIIWSCSWFGTSQEFVTGARDQKIIVWKVEALENSTRAVALASNKCPEPVTAVAVSPGPLNEAVVVAGLQSGCIHFYRLNLENKLECLTIFGQNPIPVDAAVLRLRLATFLVFFM
ncbi:unnamed protein product [Caenorhabditis auriculariae]|uniref:Elongator complex protein 2 n=1 Tax=Caenorhabditis auriculariae TaxID=2777116 RepID=A0A8S1GSF2_9PELO|nr:unnamed protein product [Caenorhabditis auriculariae]